MTPSVIAHRGDSAHAPENTLRSVRQALAKNADWIEVDLQLTRDGQAVVFHDEDLHRLTGQIGRVENHSSSELRDLHVMPSLHEPGDDSRITDLTNLLAEPNA